MPLDPKLSLQPFDATRLDRLPHIDSLASDLLNVDPTDPDFAPPALTNQWAALMAGRDLFSYRGLSTPDLYHEGIQAELFLGVNGEGMRPAAELSQPLNYRWFPSRVVRSFSWEGLNFESELLLSVQGQVVLERLKVGNTGEEPQRLDLMLRLLADLRDEWQTTWPPEDTVKAAIELDERRHALRLLHKSGACALTGADFPTESVASFAEGDPRWLRAHQASKLDNKVSPHERYAVLHYRFEVAPGDMQELRWVHTLGADRVEAEQAFDKHRGAFDSCCRQATRAWEHEWRAAFTPGGAGFSGVAPLVESSNPKVARLYYMGILTLLYCKRTSTFGGAAQTYITGFPSSRETFPVNWVFPWDTKMIAGILSLLDPAVLKAMIVGWLEADLHQGCALDFVTKRPVGFWYAVNDYALVHMCDQYLRYTGDRAFLSEIVRGQPVLRHLEAAALYYTHLSDDDGLADYGSAENLLECVSSYTHKVASFNAANVWNLRTVACFFEIEGSTQEAEALRARADALVLQVLSLYVPGEGIWACLQPDGRKVTVRHCLDFFTTAQSLPEDLSVSQLEEMVAFFLRELRTETWMHALSPLDPDTVFSSRTDHQDEGAYTTWPAYCFEVLMQTGHEAEAVQWLGDESRPGLADVTRQGPFGQAYCHGDALSPRFANAGAKAPIEPPHIEKPVLVSGGKYAQIIVEALAGLRPTLFGEPLVENRQLPFSLVIDHILLRGRLYSISHPR